MSVEPTYYVPATIACDVCGLRASVELAYVAETLSIDRVPDEIGPILRTDGRLPEGWRKVVAWPRDCICCAPCAKRKDAEFAAWEKAEKNLQRRARQKKKATASSSD